MMVRPIHPFPARMAPDLAIDSLREVRKQGVVLDPMVGSGTVVRQAADLGYRALGFDMDPLAVLMSQVWTTPVDDARVERLTKDVLARARRLTGDVELPWLDDDDESVKFSEYWFASPQREDLRRLAYVLSQLESSVSRDQSRRGAVNVLRLAMSKLIITKEQGVSLARDTSHSRPHKVAESSTVKVFPAFEKSVWQLRRLLKDSPPAGSAKVAYGDARFLKSIRNGEVDMVLTSPPYLNAIDYMRGHRLSLIWLGHKLSNLKKIRSHSIGSERGPESVHSAPLFEAVLRSMGPIEQLSRRHAAMASRYAEDLYRLMSEIARVLKPDGKAVLVVGDSCLKGTFIKNSEGIIKAASMVGLRLERKVERGLPVRSRYLPMPSHNGEPLGKRMRTENIITFAW